AAGRVSPGMVHAFGLGLKWVMGVLKPLLQSLLHVDKVEGGEYCCPVDWVWVGSYAQQTGSVHEYNRTPIAW
ncbi:hypothetical protein, partial [Bifidobacterium crudilactis]|uniref:hypothetical protein n=1 Tax=Bifidobacterium crudilactis TaxID=327277 RepID=UPI002647EDC4